MIENFLSENNCIISNKIIKPTSSVLPNYIVFADPEVERICIENWSSDGIGLTYEDAAVVIDLNNNFYENVSIVFFDELQYFTNLTLIGSNGFDGCTGLTSITIPNSVTSIGDWAFSNCKGLTSITIPNSVTSIGSSTFYNCRGLTLITIPNSVTSIGVNIFNGCTRLTSITSENINPPIMNSFALSWIPLENIYVPAESIDIYKSTEGWSAYADRITAIINPS